jgi:leader peptidase (prepilin peptidase)/N-methyltransferase
VLLWCGVAATLVALTAIDWDTTLLPDSLTLPLLWAGLCAAALGWTLPVTQSIAGAVRLPLAVVGVLAVQAHHRQGGHGAGDFKLLAALGAWLGWQAILPIVLMASVIGAVVGIGMKLGNALREGRYVPFGPSWPAAAGRDAGGAGPGAGLDRPMRAAASA